LAIGNKKLKTSVLAQKALLVELYLSGQVSFQESGHSTVIVVWFSSEIGGEGVFCKAWP